MKIDFNKKIYFNFDFLKKIKLNIDLFKNPLRLTIGGNIFAISGLLFLIFIFGIYFISVIQTKNFLAPIESLIFLIFEFVSIQFLIMFSCIVAFLLELIFRHRIKNKFFSENKIYCIVFYLGFITHIFLIIAIYYPIH